MTPSDIQTFDQLIIAICELAQLPDGPKRLSIVRAAVVAAHPEGKAEEPKQPKQPRFRWPKEIAC